MDRWDEAKERIRESLSIVSVVESYMTLPRKGAGLKALCPFHKEKTPSFHLFERTNTFYCFGCQKAGDIFTFVMEFENVGFREAMEILARRAGVELPAGREGPPSRLEALRGALTLAQEFYARTLASSAGSQARDYLAGRGLEGAIVPYGLGFAPREGSVLLAHARDRGVDSRDLEEAGLLRRSDDGRLQDYFRGRLMIPIRDALGRLVGFGGRVLDGSEPKYLNTRETPLFSKGRLLFGLDRARKSRPDRFLVVEGYTDVMASVLAGVEGVVAGLGTAFTEQQGRLLERYRPGQVVLLYDGDRAGWKAAERTLDELAPTTLDLRVALLDGGLDPADLVRLRGPEALNSLVQAARPAFQVKLDLVSGRHDLKEAAGVHRAGLELVDYLARIEDPILQDRLAREAAGRLRIGVDAFAKALGRRPAGRVRTPAAPLAAPTPDRRDLLAQEQILRALLLQPALLGEVREEEMVDPGCRRVLAGILQAAGNMADGASFRVQSLMDNLRDDQELLSKVVAWLNRPPQVGDPAGWLRTNLDHLRRRSVERRLQPLEQAIQGARAAGNDDEVVRLRRERNALILERNQISKGMEEVI